MEVCVTQPRCQIFAYQHTKSCIKYLSSNRFIVDRINSFDLVLGTKKIMNLVKNWKVTKLVGLIQAEIERFDCPNLQFWKGNTVSLYFGSNSQE